MDIDKFIICKNIKYLREVNNLKQSDMAKICHCSDTAIGAYERLERVPKSTTIFYLQEHFEIPADILMMQQIQFMDKNELKTRKIRLLIAEEIEKLNYEQLVKIQQMIDIIK